MTSGQRKVARPVAREEEPKKRRMPKRETKPTKKAHGRTPDAPSGTGPRPGEAAPLFDLPIVGAEESLDLEALRGHKAVVLFFFPRPGSPSCNREITEFDQTLADFKKRGVAVYGVCNDPPPRLERLKRELELDVPILFDPKGRIAALYGAYAMKVHMGRSYRGIIRSTFLIDRKGLVAQAWNRVHVRGHAQAVLTAVDEHTL